MKIIKYFIKLSSLFILVVSSGGCGEDIEFDTCRETQWLQPVEYEIKLAVHVSDSNTDLPGGTPGSNLPQDFEKMKVSGTIEKVECNDSTSGPVNLGNTYLNKGVDIAAELYEAEAYWIGHVVYVYEFDNDDDYLSFNLMVEIEMEDGQSYQCSVPYNIYSDQILRVPGELYYYILLDIYSVNWAKL